MSNKIENINLSGINLLIYAVLLVATPFIMLQNYLQSWVKSLSTFHVHLGSLQVPVVVLSATVIVLLVAVVFRKKLSLKVLASVLFAFIWLALGQYISDFYINYSYYDLQNNWHYLAYFVFAFVIHSYLKKRNASTQRINYTIFLLATCISLFDEIFQNLLSERIFDLSDVAKDLWGVVLGLIFINIFREPGKVKEGQQKQLRLSGIHRSLWFILFFSICFLVVSSLLTGSEYVGYVIGVTILLFLPLFLILSYYKGKTKKWIHAVLVFIIATQIVLFGVFRNHNFILHNNLLTIYKGIPLAFFDVVFYPDHTFRFADKKTEFNKTDKETLLQYKPDILLIGAGEKMEGGNGFPMKEKSHFIYNKYTNSAVQVIILDSKSACIKYNELLEKGLKTLFVLHKDL